jgi:8-oxo-dGTP pyrophosphatase MutT (NUDIX family)
LHWVFFSLEKWYKNITQNYRKVIMSVQDSITATGPVEAVNPRVRKRVEVVIRKGDEFLLIHAAKTHLYPDWRGFPGGGIDDQTEEEACVTECLEEVGIMIKNLRPLHLTLSETNVSSKGDRQSDYNSTHTSWYAAEFHAVDGSLLGRDGDAKIVEWVNYEKARARLKKSNSNRMECQLVALALTASSNLS